MTGDMINEMTDNMTDKPMTFNIALLGDSGVGKTSWMRRMMGDPFQPQFHATVGCNAKSFLWETNYGLFDLNFYDYAGQEKYGFRFERPLVAQSDATVLMFDLTSRVSYKNTKHWKQKCGGEPVFVVGNKCDIKAENIKVVPKFHENYLELSAKRMTGADLVTHILRVLSGHPDLVVLYFE